MPPPVPAKPDRTGMITARVERPEYALILDMRTTTNITCFWSDPATMMVV